jgi:hypothetical protein
MRDEEGVVVSLTRFLLRPFKAVVIVLPLFVDVTGLLLRLFETVGILNLFVVLLLILFETVGILNLFDVNEYTRKFFICQ